MVKKNEFNEIDVPPKENMMTIIVFSDELDKAVAAFNISLGALAVGMEVHLFFTFWGLSMIRKKTGDSKPIDAMLPKGDDGLPLSHDSSEGMGAKMLQQMMKDNNVPPLDFMIHLAKYDGVKFIACQMSMAVLGITEDDLIDGVEIGGVGTMLEFARKSSVNYFI